MTPVAEVIEKTNPVPRGTKVELLARTIEERAEEVLNLQLVIDRLRLDEREAVAKAVRNAPTVHTHQMNSPESKAKAKREKLERDLPRREHELEELRLVFVEAQAEASEAELRDAAKRLAQGEERQRDKLAQMGALLSQVAEVYQEYGAEVEKADQAVGLTIASESYRVATPEMKHVFDNAAARAVLLQPHPIGFGALVERLIAASLSTDNRSPDYSEMSIGQGEELELGEFKVFEGEHGFRIHDRRMKPLPPKIEKVPSTAIYLDRRRVLRDIAPDLRNLPRITLSPRVERLDGVGPEPGMNRL